MQKKSKVLRKCLRILHRNEHKHLILSNVLQTLFLLMDLVAIGLVGVVTSMSIRYVSGQEEGIRVKRILELLGMVNLVPQTKILIFAVLAAVLFMARSMASYFFNRRVALYVATRSALLSSKLLEKIFANPLDVVQEKSSQSGIYFVTQGIGQILSNVVVPFYALIPEFIYALAIFVALLYVDALAITLLTFILLLAAWILFYIQKHNTTVLGARTTKLNLDTANLMAEALSAFREISMRGAQQIYIRNVTSLRLELAKSQTIMKLQNLLSRYFLEGIMVLSVFSIGVIQVFTRNSFTSASNLAIFVAASARILPIVVKMQTSFTQMRAGLASSIEVLNYVDQLTKVSSSSIFQLPENVSEVPVRFKNVSFSYGSDRNRHFFYDLEIKRGNFLVITGQTGVGKSTLLDLALGIQAPENGRVELFGENPKGILSNQIGKVAYVPQQSFIKNASLLENLIFALPKNYMNEDLIAELLQKMNWHPMFVSRESLEVNLGEGGQIPSGGERQVIGVARALFTKPELIFLDESTSSMDAITERHILNTLSAEESMTVVMVAHRLSVISSAKQILFFQSNGKQVKGSLAELREQNLEFRTLLDSLSESEH